MYCRGVQDVFGVAEDLCAFSWILRSCIFILCGASCSEIAYNLQMISCYCELTLGWTELVEVEKFADCALITTQDQLHKVFARVIHCNSPSNSPSMAPSAGQPAREA